MASLAAQFITEVVLLLLVGRLLVASIGRSMGVISHDLFTMIVTTAIVTTLAMPPMLRWASRGFVTNLECLLLAADDSETANLPCALLA